VVLSAHMDVVEAKPEDWERDPFTPVVENGYLFGRGASDTKFEASLAVASLIELRRQGFRPRRSIVVAYSGDEETDDEDLEADRRAAQERAHRAQRRRRLGPAAEETGKPLYWTWQGREKTYIDFQLEVTNPGGHSSAPRPDNAIAQLSQALQRIAAYHFTPEINDITKAYFEQVSAIQPDPLLAAAMRAFAADPTDAEAIGVLRAT
jgi:acetylornithine deacetylase/succinyl-diaminopimelate desuccinylase-like protein